MLKTKFFTGRGDRGESQVGSKKILKSAPLVELLGSADELNSWLGFVRVEAEKTSSGKINLAEVLKTIQEDIFIIQAELAEIGFGPPPGEVPGPKITEEKTKELEKIIDLIDETLPPLKHFVVPGGSELSARLDVGRTMARRFEREAKRRAQEIGLSPALLRFLNRLSSLLFALARYANHLQGIAEEKPSYH